MKKYAPFTGTEATQIKEELDLMIDFFRSENVSSYLEIGARTGDSFKAVMESLPPNSLGIAVDMPAGKWGEDGSGMMLQIVSEKLIDKGYQTAVFFGNSHEMSVIQLVREFKRFDAVLIDGDHSYEGVKADFENFGDLAKIVAFHDIAWQPDGNTHIGVPQFWEELKASGKGRTIELIAKNSRMGIGIWISQ